MLASREGQRVKQWRQKYSDHFLMQNLQNHNGDILTLRVPSCHRPIKKLDNEARHLDVEMLMWVKRQKKKKNTLPTMQFDSLFP